ncbi:aminotransferase class III-fold pyridoxal phosphate-dependent enzyme [Inquilinus sp. CAU 1745]|uniref:aminotransferase class III-fold pyridoxal phosphate-dependent enzyme n=1 Tax=Inquilinus sp. CAU 1745 TaxID=3140369 RepID=UPI00325BE7BA
MTDLSHPAPALTVELAERLAREHFGVTGRLTGLDSERDRNFRLRDGDGTSRVLKIVNASEPVAESDFQTALLEHIERHDPSLPVPRLRRTLGGDALARIEIDGADHAVRLVSWIDGTPLAEAERTQALLADLGRTLGRLDRTLQGFIHPGALRSFDWDIRRAGASRDRLHAIEDETDRRLLLGFLDRFDGQVAPRLPTLPAAIIHNDANDWNVLVTPDGARIAGLIDFGDALHSARIAELAVAIAYGILDLDDPLAAAGAILAGYHAVHPVSEAEIDLLFDLVAMRLVTSVTLSAMRRAQVASNPYLSISEAPAWRLLRRLGGMNPRFATAILRHAAGFEPFPGSAAVIRWIAERKAGFAPILDPHPAVMAKAIVPFGDPAHPMTLASAGREPAKATEWWDDHCRENGVTLGIGPWGEERTVYASDIFVSRLIEGERRTRHLGLDLFMDAGTPVRTPVDATVRSVEIEEAPLGYGCLITLLHEPEGCPPFLTLWGHMAHEAMARLRPGDRLAAGEIVGYMGAPEENGGWAPHLHFQISVDTDLAPADILGVGEAAYLPVWAALFPDAADLAGLPPESFGDPGRPPEEIVTARRKHLLPNLSVSYADPIKFVRGEGSWLIDHRGRAYLDCFNNVCHLGHCHPAVVEALARQAARLNTNTRYLHDGIMAYVERLTATLPEGLSVAALACSGSEANSLALRMARAHSGRPQAIVLDWAYHGTMQELIDLSPYKYKCKGGSGRPAHVFEAAIPDAYRAPEDWPAYEIAARYADSVAEQIEEMARQGLAPGYFIAESIPSVAGQIFLPDGYLARVYEMVRAAGGVCIADEVQVGFGRVGDWWAFESQGVTPDIVTMGKPIGNGHPMSALVTTEAVARSFDNGMEYFNTFGGNPVSCAVGLAVLDAIERDGLRGNARRIGHYLLERFRDMQKRHEAIGDVRGKGLFLGVELVRDRRTKEPATDLARRIADGAKQRGVLIGTEGPYDNVLKMRPPMVFSHADADYFMEVMEDTFAALA